MNKLINGYSYIEVPSWSINHKLHRDDGFDEPTYISYERSGDPYRDGFDLPDLFEPEHYEIIGKKLSEDEWKMFFDSGSPLSNTGVFTATESGLSLLKSLNLLDKYERGEILILKESYA